MNPQHLPPAAARALRAGLVVAAIVLAAWQRDRASLERATRRLLAARGTAG